MDPRPHPIIMRLWFQRQDREKRRVDAAETNGTDYWKNTFTFCTRSSLLITITFYLISIFSSLLHTAYLFAPTLIHPPHRNLFPFLPTLDSSSFPFTSSCLLLSPLVVFESSKAGSRRANSRWTHSNTQLCHLLQSHDWAEKPALALWCPIITDTSISQSRKGWQKK